MKRLILTGVLSFFLVGQVSCIPNNNLPDVYTKGNSEERKNLLTGILVGAAIPAVVGTASYLLADDPMAPLDGQTTLGEAVYSPMVITACAGGAALIGSLLGHKYCEDPLMRYNYNRYLWGIKFLGASVGSFLATPVVAAILDPNRN